MNDKKELARPQVLVRRKSSRAYCPTCGSHIQVFERKGNCPYCTQAIDWQNPIIDRNTKWGKNVKHEKHPAYVSKRYDGSKRRRSQK